MRKRIMEIMVPFLYYLKGCRLGNAESEKCQQGNPGAKEKTVDIRPPHKKIKPNQLSPR
jgi:hypothetical protein